MKLINGIWQNKDYPIYINGKRKRAIVVPSGPDAYTMSLLHLNGVDASTTITDETGKTWTARGHGQLDTAQYKWTSSLLCDNGNDDYVDTPDHADFSLGNGEWCIEFWVRLATINHDYYFLGHSNSAINDYSFYFYIDSANTLAGHIHNGTADKSISSSGEVTFLVNTWYHVALLRQVNTMKMYIGGTALSGTQDLTGNTIRDSGGSLAVGRVGDFASMNLDGWIDEFRLSVGTCRYTANFTPPAAEF